MDSETARGAVVISGASTGIGRACALHLDGMGFEVFAGVRTREDADALREASSGRLTPIMLDITEAGSISGARKLVADSVGAAGLAGLVNNAGIVVPGPLEYVPIEGLRSQLNVNLVGHVAMIQTFLPLLRLSRGRIINVTSIGGRQPVPFMSPYCASKAGLEALTDSLRMELRPLGIPVSIVTPGNVSTPIWRKTAASADEYLRQMPKSAEDLYGSAFEKTFETSSRMAKKGIPPEVAARVVARALTASRPRARYVVGLDAKAQILMARLLPDRIRDLIVTRYIALNMQKKRSCKEHIN